LPPHQQNKARQLGLSLALVTRILLLLSITWIMGLKGTLFAVLGHDFSGRDLILLAGAGAGRSAQPSRPRPGEARRRR